MVSVGDLTGRRGTPTRHDLIVHAGGDLHVVLSAGWLGSLPTAVAVLVETVDRSQMPEPLAIEIPKSFIGLRMWIRPTQLRTVAVRPSPLIVTRLDRSLGARLDDAIRATLDL